MFWTRPGLGARKDEPLEKIGQIIASVEPILSFCKVAVCVLRKLEPVVGSIDRGLEVADQGVDPAKARHLGTFAVRSNYLRLMGASDRRDRSEALQAIGDDHRGRGERAMRPGFHLLEAERLDL